MTLKSLRAKLSSPAVRRDPMRMAVRPLLRYIDLSLSRRSGNAETTRRFGNGAAAEYQVRELLDRSRYLYGMHEYVSSSVFVAHISAGSLVLDVGANIGEYAVLAARTTGELGQVIAYEPNPEARTRLASNVRLNRLSNVEISSDALGVQDGEAVLRVPGNVSGLGTLREGASGSEHKVRVRRLDSLLRERDISRLGTMKVDVEGLELQVFQGAQRTIAAARPWILYECASELFEHRGGRLVTPAMQFLEDEGYDNFVVTMTRSGTWALKQLSADDDPRRYREPWEVLVVVAISRDRVKSAQLRGASSLRPCSVLELLGR